MIVTAAAPLRPPRRACDVPLVLVLALDTSTPLTVAGLVEVQAASAPRTLAREVVPPPAKAGAVLPALLESVCATAGVPLTSLGALVCGVGPGSFTGLRVGLAAAKGLAYALRLPLAGVSSLRALAHDALAQEHDPLAAVVPLLEARRGELFAGAFARADDGALAERAAPRVLLAGQVGAFAASLGGAALLVGAGVDANRAVLEATRAPHARLSPAGALLAPEPSGLVAVAGPGLLAAAFDLAALFAVAPDYLAPSEPEKALAAGKVGRLAPGS